MQSTVSLNLNQIKSPSGKEVAGYISINSSLAVLFSFTLVPFGQGCVHQ